ncbi:site-specific integrase [Mycobacterium riyadhense]|uniref:site-specific integrase n=1 Tax=Mycobacterium riyadhense TaxID=486698 RepID=UPI00194DCD24|nr:site-specific integrase [Mycobacterium riyadhense]
MFDDFEDVRDLSVLEVRAVGSLAATGSKWEPYRLLGPADQPVGAVASFFGDLLAAGCSEATVRSYGMDLLRWFRFLWAVEVAWDRATRLEARDFCRWLAITNGRRGSGRARPYSVSVRVHSETVLRCFYDFHRDVGAGPMVNPFPAPLTTPSGAVLITRSSSTPTTPSSSSKETRNTGPCHRLHPR